MGLSLGPAGAEEAQRGARGPGEGEGDEAHQEAELARVAEAGVLEVEAAGLGVAKETFDGPAPAVGRERQPGRAVGGDDEPLAALEPLGGEGNSATLMFRVDGDALTLEFVDGAGPMQGSTATLVRAGSGE